MDFPTLEEAALVASGAALVKFAEWIQAFVGRRTRLTDQKEAADATRASALWESFRLVSSSVVGLEAPLNPEIGGHNHLRDATRQQMLARVGEAMKSIHQIRRKAARERLVDIFELLRWEANTIRDKFGSYAIHGELRKEAEAVLGALMRHESPGVRSARLTEMLEAHYARVDALDQSAETYEQQQIAAREKAASEIAKGSASRPAGDRAESGDANDDRG